MINIYVKLYPFYISHLIAIIVFVLEGGPPGLHGNRCQLGAAFFNGF